MRRIILLSGLAAGFFAIVLTADGPAFAEKPSWDDDGKKGKAFKELGRQGPEQIQSEDRRVESPRPQRNTERGPRHEYRHSGTRDKDRSVHKHDKYFSGRDRAPIDRYYADQYRRGKCPPGLVKKGNRCMPSGQVKKWRLYRPLPREVIFYDLPPEVEIHLGPPPSGHRFVRVAQDILLITVGTGMVIDAVEDLGRID